MHDSATDPSAAQGRGTTTAIGPNGRTIHFDDLVSDGELVEVEGRPMIVYYDAAAPDWFVEERHNCGAATSRVEQGADSVQLNPESAPASSAARRHP